MTNFVAKMKKNKKRHIQQKNFGQIRRKSKKSFIFVQNMSSLSWFLSVITMTDMTDKMENTNPNWHVLPSQWLSVTGQTLYRLSYASSAPLVSTTGPLLWSNVTHTVSVTKLTLSQHKMLDTIDHYSLRSSAHDKVRNNEAAFVVVDLDFI